MRLNGALRPHGAPYIGRSIGAKNYRDKQPRQQKPKYNYNNCNYNYNYNYNNTKPTSDQSNKKENNNITTLPAAEANNFKRTPGYNPLDDDDDVEFDDIFFDNQLNQNNTNHQGSCVSTLAKMVVTPAITDRPGKMAFARKMASGMLSTDESPCLRLRLRSCERQHQRQRHLMRVPQSLVAGLNRFSALLLCSISVLALLPSHVICDDDNGFFVNSFSIGPETTTPEFDYVSRGRKKFGDKCENTLECGFPGSICDPKKRSCQCVEELPVTNHIDKCGKEAAVNESCFFHEQCESFNFQTECRDGRCICRFEMTPVLGKDGVFECQAGNKDKRGPETYIDPAMIGVLIGMALMFVIICVVLRLFSQARWRENRTIFNTPNPRLMNVSLLRDSKLLHGQERRGSRMSQRVPSRQPSMASLRPHSPNPSLGKTGSRSGSGSNASATSVRSTRSNSVAPGAINHDRKTSAAAHHHHHHHQHQPQQQPLITNITSNPAAENVTVEIREPENK